MTATLIDPVAQEKTKLVNLEQQAEIVITHTLAFYEEKND